MQKKLIALAVAALASSSAFAQVTVGGIADAGFFTSKTTVGGATTSKTSGINSGHLSGSRLIFKADEDLGNGLSAGAYYEVAVNLDNGDDAGTTNTNTVAGAGAHTVTKNGLFGMSRQSFVSLKSASVGEFRLGRQYSAASAASTQFDPFAGSPTLSVQQDVAVDIGSDLASGGTRHNNTFGYIAPKFGGFQLTGSYTFGEQNTANGATAAKALSLSGTYTVGSLVVGGLYTARSDVGGTAAGADANDITDIGIGASYDLGVVKLFAMFQNFEDEEGTFTDEADQISLGALVPLGAGNIHFAYVQAEDEVSDTGVTLGKEKATAFSIAYTHALSKRTTAYVGYTTRKWKDDLDPIDPAATSKVTSAAIGLRHSF